MSTFFKIPAWMVFEPAFSEGNRWKGTKNSDNDGNWPPESTAMVVVGISDIKERLLTDKRLISLATADHNSLGQQIIPRMESIVLLLFFSPELPFHSWLPSSSSLSACITIDSYHFLIMSFWAWFNRPEATGSILTPVWPLMWARRLVTAENGV